jgi:hypothetical protein
MGEEKKHIYGLLVGNPEGRKSLGRLGGWIILRWVLER